MQVAITIPMIHTSVYPKDATADPFEGEVVNSVVAVNVVDIVGEDEGVDEGVGEVDEGVGLDVGEGDGFGVGEDFDEGVGEVDAGVFGVGDGFGVGEGVGEGVGVITNFFVYTFVEIFKNVLNHLIPDL